MTPCPPNLSPEPVLKPPKFNNCLQITHTFWYGLQKTLPISLSDQLFNLVTLRQSLLPPIFNFTEKFICKSSCYCFITTFDFSFFSVFSLNTTSYPLHCFSWDFFSTNLLLLLPSAFWIKLPQPSLLQSNSILHMVL